MQAQGGVEAGNKYGTEAGYSEDYGAPKHPQEFVDDQGYGTMTSTNGAGAHAGGGQPANPFTQQTYEQKSSNPFKQ